MKEYPRIIDHYPALVRELKAFRTEPTPILSPLYRQELAHQLLELVYGGNQKDKNSAIRLAKQLLKSDQLSDQQAGVLARSRRDLHLEFNLGEILTVIGGDWDEITKIFQSDPIRQTVFQNNLNLVTKADSVQIVYRELDIDPADAVKIKASGLIPAGVCFNNSFDQTVWSELDWSFGRGPAHLINAARFDLSRWAICKANLFSEVWAYDEMGMSSPYKLGQSTTTYTQLRNPRRLYHGRLLFELAVESNRLVREGQPGWMDDEHTVLYDIEPGQILAIYDCAGIDKNDVWKMVSRNPLQRMLSHQDRRLA